MLKRQVVLAVIGGGCLGCLLGCVLGAVVGRYFAPVESWQERELYGFLALAARLRSTGIGAILGGTIGAVAGGLLGGWPGRARREQPKT